MLHIRPSYPKLIAVYDVEILITTCRGEDCAGLRPGISGMKQNTSVFFPTKCERKQFFLKEIINNHVTRITDL
jgi:hypothetical protein